MISSKLSPFLTTMAFVILSHSLCAQQLFSRKAAPINAVLWKIEGNGLSKPSYVLGTMHLLCSDTYTIPTKVKEVLENVDSLCLEMKLNDPLEIAYLQQQAMADPKLSETLTEEQIEKLKVLLPKKTGMTFEQLEVFTLGTISSLIASETMECKSPITIEIELINLVEASSKPIIALETAKEQIEILSDLITAEQLIESLEQSELNQKAISRATQLYTEEKVSEAVTELMSTADMTPAEMDALIYNRNRAWVKSMTDQMKESSVLYAVGAGHLVESEGLIALLQKEGYTVSPVTLKGRE